MKRENRMDSSEIRKMSAEQKEAFHRESETRMQPLRYTPPESGKPKDVVMLGRSGHLRTLVQIVKEGGENNLHYHTNSDTTWLVLKGRARFYGVGDVLIGDYGPCEGILIPGGSRYWFEKAGDEVLELLQVVGVDSQGGKSERINLDTHKDWMEDNERLKTYE
jgi:mannose-6-phosphate isomerase-like protein (cupin superfamily)